MNTARQGQFAGLGAAVLFGCSAPLVSTLTGAGSALSIAGLLYAGATLALLTVGLVRGTRAETPIRREDWPALAVLTLLGGMVAPVALVLGLARLPAASSSLLLNLEAVFTLTIAVLLGREHLGRRGLVSALLTIVGAVVLSQGSLSGANALGGALIGLELQKLGHRLDALPLVGHGRAYGQAGLPLLGRTREYSTGGLGYTSLLARLTEVLQGRGVAGVCQRVLDRWWVMSAASWLVRVLVHWSEWDKVLLII